MLPTILISLISPFVYQCIENNFNKERNIEQNIYDNYI